jgi:hypothetical protein
MVRKRIVKRRSYKLYDAFPKKATAKSSARDLRKSGQTASVRKIKAQGGGRLKYGLFTAGARK